MATPPSEERETRGDQLPADESPARDGGDARFGAPTYRGPRGPVGRTARRASWRAVLRLAGLTLVLSVLFAVTGPARGWVRRWLQPEREPGRVAKVVPQPPPPASFELAGVTVRTRAAWGARRVVGRVQPLGRARRVTVHHLGESDVRASGTAETARLLRSVQRVHQEERRWADIAYHFVVDRAGRVWEGREMRWQGAHAGPGANGGNVGVLVVGSFDNTRPTSVQIDSLARLLGALEETHAIPPGEVWTHAEVRRSAQLGATKCPGKHLAGWVVDYRRGAGGAAARARSGTD